LRYYIPLTHNYISISKKVPIFFNYCTKHVVYEKKFYNFENINLNLPLKMLPEVTKKIEQSLFIPYDCGCEIQSVTYIFHGKFLVGPIILKFA
jgi:hypothetical protein